MHAMALRPGRDRQHGSPHAHAAQQRPPLTGSIHCLACPLLSGYYTPLGYSKRKGVAGMAKDRSAILNRLNRIEGQVRGVRQMVADDRYCIDILHQVQAVKAALARAESEILKDHAACCITEAIASGDQDEQRAKFSELVDLFEKVKG
jgi:CsoR family transcriptional regulator, copper-sensing transcriptional repressor